MVEEPPTRFPKNVPGDFYTTGSLDPDGNWRGDCLACGAPEHDAPDLLAPLMDGNFDTYFVKQPQTDQEIHRACQAIGVCCVAALRYGGSDPAIIMRLGNTAIHSDFLLVNERVVFVGRQNVEFPKQRVGWWKSFFLWLRSMFKS